jgi:hypothetical protein
VYPEILYIEITPFSFVLHKEYDFDCIERLSRSALHRGDRGVCIFVLCSLATVLFCIDPSVRIVTKSPKVGPRTSTFILISQNVPLIFYLRRRGSSYRPHWLLLDRPPRLGPKK